jgi:competence protein ComEA
MKFKTLILAIALSVVSFSSFAETVNLNKANAAALQHYLKGVGNKKAKDIIEYRKQHKGFKTIDEIMEVKGIGKSTFKKIKADLSLSKGVVSAPGLKEAKKNKKTIKAPKMTEPKSK